MIIDEDGNEIIMTDFELKLAMILVDDEMGVGEMITSIQFLIADQLKNTQTYPTHVGRCKSLI